MTPLPIAIRTDRRARDRNHGSSEAVDTAQPRLVHPKRSNDTCRLQLGHRWSGGSRQSNTDQQISFLNRWSSSTSSRIASGSWPRCHWHSSPPALSPPPVGAAACRCGSTCGLDRIGGCTEFVGGNVRDARGLASGVRGMPRCSTQVSGRAHGMAARCASLHHLHLATDPSLGMLNRLARSRVVRLHRLEVAQDVLCARCREEVVIRIGEGPTAADSHETRISDLRKNHRRTPSDRCRSSVRSAR